MPDFITLSPGMTEEQVLETFEKILVDNMGASVVPKVENPMLDISVRDPDTGTVYDTSWVQISPSNVYSPIEDGSYSEEFVEVPTFTLAGGSFTLPSVVTPRPSGSAVALWVSADHGKHPDGRNRKALISTSVIKKDLVVFLMNRYPDSIPTDALKALDSNQHGDATSISMLDAAVVANAFMQYLIEYGGPAYQHLQQILNPVYGADAYFTKDTDKCGVSLPEVSDWIVTARGGMNSNLYLYLGTDNYEDLSKDDQSNVHSEMGLNKVRPGSWLWSQTPVNGYNEFVDNSSIMNIMNNYGSIIMPVVVRIMTLAKSKFNYRIGDREVDYDFFIRYAKTQYGSLRRFHNEIEINNILPWGFQFVVARDFINARPFTAEEMMNEGNSEMQRLMLSVIPPEELFTTLGDPVKEIHVLKENTRFDSNNNTIIQQIDTYYQMYKVALSTLGITVDDDEERERFIEDPEANVDYSVVVRVTCPSTDRVYIIPVHPRYLGDQYTVMDAVASTFHINIKEEDIKYIFRQGDVMGVCSKSGSDTVPTYTLTGEAYTRLLQSEA